MRQIEYKDACMEGCQEEGEGGEMRWIEDRDACMDGCRGRG